MTKTTTTSVLEQCYALLSKTKSNVVWEILRQTDKFFEWDHYPSGDVFDKETFAQYYFHAHAWEAGSRWEEHGHFHLFLRKEGMPVTHQPQPLLPVQEGVKTEDLCHLCAISMDKFGQPIRLFTTNRWVTNETWYRADDVIDLIPRFAITHAWPSWPTNIWITHMVQSYQHEIANLIRQRDRVIAEWQAAHPDINVFEDRNLEVTSVLDL